MEKVEFICISCPMGCRLTVERDLQNEHVSVTGNACKKGESYGRMEAIHPTRVLTTTVSIKGGRFKRLPVRTKEPIPKELLMKAMEILREIQVNAPIGIGQVIVRNILDTGVDVIASRDLKLASDD